MYIYGGKNGLYNTNWFIEIEMESLSIKEVKCGPLEIDSHSAIYDEKKDRMIVYGGFVSG